MFEILKSFSPATAARHNLRLSFSSTGIISKIRQPSHPTAMSAGCMGMHYRNHYCNSPRYCCSNQYFRGFI